MNISTGGNAPDAEIETGPHCQVPFAEQVREETSMPAAAVDLIAEPDQAQDVITCGQADTVLLGHELLRYPDCARHATAEPGGEAPSPRPKPPLVTERRTTPCPSLARSPFSYWDTPLGTCRTGARPPITSRPALRSTSRQAALTRTNRTPHSKRTSPLLLRVTVRPAVSTGRPPREDDATGRRSRAADRRGRQLAIDSKMIALALYEL